MKRNVFLGLLVILLISGFIGCDNGNGNGNFVAVTGIENVANEMAIGSPFLLNGTVEPYNATNKNIVWSIKDGRNTGAVLSGNSLNVTGRGTDWGNFEITATIPNGLTNGNDFTKDFTVRVSTYNKITNTVHFVAIKGDFGSNPHTNQGLKLQDFYTGQLKKNTTYEVTLNGNLDTNINGWISVYFAANLPVEEGEDGYAYWSNFHGFSSGLLSGPIQFSCPVKTFDFDEVEEYGGLALIELSYDHSDDPDAIADADVGKVTARIFNLTLSIEEIDD